MGSGSAGPAPPPTSTRSSRPGSTRTSPPCGSSACRSRPTSCRRFYEGFSNGVLWPLFHYLLDQIPLQVSDWDGYVEANEAFADVVAAHYRPGDMIWVHDYQLLLVPGLLRERLPGRPDRLLPPHPVPVGGAVPDAAVARPHPAGHARRRPRRLPHPGVPAPLRHLAHRHARPLGRDRPGPAPGPRGRASASSRWASTPRRSPRWRPIPRSRARSRPSGATAACGS